MSQAINDAIGAVMLLLIGGGMAVIVIGSILAKLEQVLRELAQHNGVSIKREILDWIIFSACFVAVPLAYWWFGS